MGFLSQVTDILNSTTKHLNTITSGGGSGFPSGKSIPNFSGMSGGTGGITTAMDNWGSRILDVLQDINRGVWSLVNAISSGHLGGSRGQNTPSLATFNPLMPASPIPNFSPQNQNPSPSLTAPKDDGIVASLAKWAGKMIPAMTDKKEMRGIGSGLEATGDVIGDIGGKLPGTVGMVAGAVGVVVKFGAALAKATDKLMDWGNQLHDNNMQFAEFSGAMSAVKARDEIRQMRISRERGDRRAKSAEYLAESKSALDRNTSKTRDAWGSLSNVVIGAISDGVAKIVKPLDDAIGYLAALVGLTDKDKDKPTNFAMWQDWIGFDGIDNYAVPDRLKGGPGNS